MKEGPLTQHLGNAAHWLNEAAEGVHSTYLCYVALELRYGAERLAVHYWSQLEHGAPETFDPTTVGSFKSLETQIYKLAGHQREINLTYDYFSILLGALGIEWRLSPPNIPLLSKIWHQCSEICHVGWILRTRTDETLAGATFLELDQHLKSLQHMAEQSPSIPLFDGPEAVELRNGFVRGSATAADIQAWIKQQGLYAVYKPPMGPAEFLGTPVPPGDA